MSIPHEQNKLKVSDDNISVKENLTPHKTYNQQKQDSFLISVIQAELAFNSNENIKPRVSSVRITDE